MYMSVNRQGDGRECAHVYECKQVGGGGGSVCLYMSLKRLGSAGCTGSCWYRASTFWGD